MDGLLNKIEDSLNQESLNYVNTHITTKDTTIQVIAGIAFADGVRYVLNKLRNE